MKKDWKRIDEFDNYIIFRDGSVKNTRTGRLLTPHFNKKRGYFYISLQQDCRRKNFLLHRLVAKYFVKNKDDKPQVNHIDCNTKNNNHDNLEWVTAKENIQHCINLGRKVQVRGNKCGYNVLTEKKVIKIKKILIDGGKTYNEIAKKFNTNYSNIAHIKRGTRWGWL